MTRKRSMGSKGVAAVGFVVATAAVWLTATAGPSYAASFDCTTASSIVETLICRDPALSQLDDRLSDAYSAARTRSGNAPQLSAEQRAWMAQRNQCQTAACVSGAYSARISALENGIQAGPTTSSQASQADNAPATMCDTAAAFPYDNGRQAQGVGFNALNPSVAIPQCVDAIARYPNSGRLHFQLGRALEKANRLAEAITAYRRASEVGHGGGYNNLGELYRDGKGLPRDLVQAEQLFRQGAALKYPEAQFNLANMLLKAPMNVGNVEQARQLLSAAVAAGYVDAVRPLQALGPQSAPAIGQPQLVDPQTVPPSFAEQVAAAERARAEARQRQMEEQQAAQRRMADQQTAQQRVAEEARQRQLADQQRVAEETRQRQLAEQQAALRLSAERERQLQSQADELQRKLQAAERERQAEAQRAALDAQQRSAVAAQQRAEAAERERQQAVAMAQRDRQIATERETQLRAQADAARVAAEQQTQTTIILAALTTGVAAIGGLLFYLFRRRRHVSQGSVPTTELPTSARNMSPNMLDTVERLPTHPQFPSSIPLSHVPPISVAEAIALVSDNPDTFRPLRIADTATNLLGYMRDNLLGAKTFESVVLLGANTVTAAQATSLVRLPSLTLSKDATLNVKDTTDATHYQHTQHQPASSAPISLKILAYVRLLMPSDFEAQRIARRCLPLCPPHLTLETAISARCCHSLLMRPCVSALPQPH